MLRIGIGRQPCPNSVANLNCLVYATNQSARQPTSDKKVREANERSAEIHGHPCDQGGSQNHAGTTSDDGFVPRNMLYFGIFDRPGLAG
jgi:hypothetical protein